MNILIWSPFIQKVGTTTNVENLIRGFSKYSKNKHQIDLINVFGEWDDYVFNDKNVKKISLSNLNFIKNNKKNGFYRSRFYTILIILFSFIPLLKILNKKNYDYVFAHLITSLPIILVGIIKKKLKLVLNISGFPKLTLLRSFFWKVFEKNIYKVVCPSNETKEILLEKKIFKTTKLHVIKDPHISANTIVKKKRVNLNNSLKPKNNIITIGRLTKQKNYLFMMEGFKKILDINNDLYLTIIGEGEDRKSIEDKINELNIEKNVKLIGFQKNIYNYLKDSMCYLSTSLWEGPDLAMLDAAFLNIPLICSNCKSGRKEFIDDNKRGYLFETNSIGSFVKTFQRFLNEDKKMLRKKVFEAKKEVKNFTSYRFYKSFMETL